MSSPKISCVMPVRERDEIIERQYNRFAIKQRRSGADNSADDHGNHESLKIDDFNDGRIRLFHYPMQQNGIGIPRCQEFWQHDGKERIYRP